MISVIKSVFSGGHLSQIRKSWQGWEGCSGEVSFSSGIKSMAILSHSSGISLEELYVRFLIFRLPEEAMIEIKASTFNRSTNSNILIYNRVAEEWIYLELESDIKCGWGIGDFMPKNLLQVPKCGSTTVGDVVKELMKRNNFSYHASQNYWRYFICICFLLPQEIQVAKINIL